jgi:hypothetical protein
LILRRFGPRLNRLLCPSSSSGYSRAGASTGKPKSFHAVLRASPAESAARRRWERDCAANRASAGVTGRTGSGEMRLSRLFQHACGPLREVRRRHWLAQSRQRDAQGLGPPNQPRHANRRKWFRPDLYVPHVHENVVKRCRCKNRGLREICQSPRVHQTTNILPLFCGRNLRLADRAEKGPLMATSVIDWPGTLSSRSLWRERLAHTGISDGNQIGALAQKV